MVIRTSRRALLAGTFAALSTSGAFATAGCRVGPMLPAVRVGLLEAADPGEEAAALLAVRAMSGIVEFTPFRSWGSLIDHLTAPSGGIIDAAIVPGAALARLDARFSAIGRFAAVPLSRPAPGGIAALLFSPAVSSPHAGPPGPLVLARAIADPLCDARLLLETRALHRQMGSPRLIELGPAAMQSNAAAGTVDVALLTGPDAERWTARHERAGLNVRRLSAVDARALSPRLALVVRPERAGRLAIRPVLVTPHASIARSDVTCA